jgi:hypothetical protein
MEPHRSDWPDGTYMKLTAPKKFKVLPSLKQILSVIKRPIDRALIDMDIREILEQHVFEPRDRITATSIAGMVSFNVKRRFGIMIDTDVIWISPDSVRVKTKFGRPMTFNYHIMRNHDISSRWS